MKTLKVQRRMRPEISRIPRLLYPEIEDGLEVKHFESIRGMKMNLCFVDHKELEH